MHNGARGSKAHPVYASLGALFGVGRNVVAWFGGPVRLVVVCLVRVTAFGLLKLFLLTRWRLAANLPCRVRQSEQGADVIALVPIYLRHLQPETVTETEHPRNNKRLLWTVYQHILGSLIDDDSEPDMFVGGFRCVPLLTSTVALHECFRGYPLTLRLPLLRCTCLFTLPRTGRRVGRFDISFADGGAMYGADVYTCLHVFLGGAFVFTFWLQPCRRGMTRSVCFIGV